MARSRRSKAVVCVSLAGDILVAATKFAASTLTGSASMFAEGIHSAVDAGNGALLLYGYQRSQRGPDNALGTAGSSTSGASSSHCSCSRWGPAFRSSKACRAS